MSNSRKISLPEDRYFGPDPRQKEIALHLYRQIADLPLICPHGHVEPQLFAEADYTFGNPAELLIIPDHYVFRMLYSQGVPLERLGITRCDGGEVETDPRQIWQIFADYFYLFQGTPTGLWLTHEFYDVFGIETKLTGETAQEIYDQIGAKLASPAFTPRALYEQFNIEVLCTTDVATDTLEHHQVIRDSGWSGRILPTFRPDTVIHLGTPNWINEIETLSAISGLDIVDYRSYLTALENRRTFFKTMGATATDHAATTAYTEALSDTEAETIFQRALRGETTAEDARRFTGHMLIEMARMSIEDGLVMQLHVGSYRNHNQALFQQFGPNMGADIPLSTEFTKNLLPLLTRFGNHPDLTLIIFNLDETTYARELAPLAGHYPAVKLGPPWWFHDSWNGMQRYFDQVVETAGIYNTTGFNDDTRAYPSIPARHDVWRRASANWVANLVACHMVDLDDAEQMMQALVYDLAKQAYKLE